MKKRFLSILFLFFVLLLFCAFDWPPEPYEMPRTVLTPDVVTDSLYGLRLSIRSIANTGLIVLGILIPFSMIGVVFEKHIFRPLRIQEGVAKNQFRREIKAADRKKNMDFIVQDRVMEMEINHAAKLKFRKIHPDYDMEERIYQKELSHKANFEYVKRHSTFAGGKGRRR